MPESEFWLTKLFNDALAGPASSFLHMIGTEAENPARPWTTWLVMEILVVALIMVLVAILRASLSAEKPGTFQHLFELAYEFLKDQARSAGIPHPEKYLGFFGTVFFFILTANLIGAIPLFESPTMWAYVPLGVALCTFFYYNFMGLKENGPIGYAKQFIGPVWWLSWLILPIELISHLARPMSLTMRLYGNIFAGEQVTNVFLKLTYLLVPVIFMALHVFVALVQTYVFTLLAMIYVSGAVSHEH
jgi:F-type H+-transporting ATPase subunit a